MFAVLLCMYVICTVRKVGEDAPIKTLYIHWKNTRCLNVIYVQSDLKQASFGVNVLVEDIQNKLKL